MSKEIIAEKAGRFANLVEIGKLTASQIRTVSRDNNPINKMYQVLTSLLKEQGVEKFDGAELSISDIVVTLDTEKMVQDQTRKWMKKKYKGFKKAYIDKQMAWVCLETPATLGVKVSGKNKETKQLEKLMGLKKNRVYVVKEELEKAQKGSAK